MYIYVFPKEECLKIARKLRRNSSDIDDLLCYLPDDVFNKVGEVVEEYDEYYRAKIGDAKWNFPKEFTKSVSYSLCPPFNSSDIINTVSPVSTISSTLTIGNDPWVMKINLETAVVKVNPEIIDKQTDEAVKTILQGIDNMVLECYLREKKKRIDVTLIR